ELREEGFRGEPRIERSISMRYAGQNYERDVVAEAERVDAAALQAVFRAFERLHERFYGYSITGEVIELISFNVTAVGRTAKPNLGTLAPGPMPAPVARRPVYFAETGYVATPIYRREQLPADARLDGP